MEAQQLAYALAISKKDVTADPQLAAALEVSLNESRQHEGRGSAGAAAAATPSESEADAQLRAAIEASLHEQQRQALWRPWDGGAGGGAGGGQQQQQQSWGGPTPRADLDPWRS